MDQQRNQAVFEKLILKASSAKTMFAVTVINENIEVTVTIEDKKNLPTQLDLNMIKELVREYIITTDNPDFDSVINNIYYIVALRYPGRDIEVMIYDNVEFLTVMKIFNHSINPPI